jgi:hypothetical protein
VRIYYGNSTFHLFIDGIWSGIFVRQQAIILFLFLSPNIIDKITMKYIVAALIFSQATAFTAVPTKTNMETRLFAGEYVPMEGEGKISESKYCISACNGLNARAWDFESSKPRI